MTARPPIRWTPAPPAKRHKRSDTLFVPLVAFVVIVVLGAALWVSATAIGEKIRLSYGLRQIIEIATSIQTVAKTEQKLGQTPHEDLLRDLQRLNSYTVTGERGDGLTTVANPWSGELTAFAPNERTTRVESVVPAHICRRIVDLFGEDRRGFGVQMIEARQNGTTWHPAYTTTQEATDADIEMACGTEGWSVIALSFSLH